MNNDKIPHTFAAFQARYVVENNSRVPGCQESFDAGMRAGRDLQWAERATTASAAPTTVQMPETWDYNVLRERMEPRAGGGFIHISDARTYGAARAEEARREAASEYEPVIQSLREELELQIEAAQNTVGGDAVAKAIARMPHIRCEYDSEETDGAYRHGFQAARLAAVDIAMKAQPVAEAAAQADDWKPHNGLGVWHKPDAKPTTLYRTFAAPTAQPTPVAETFNAMLEAGSAIDDAAQPTPDEIAKRASTAHDLASMTKIDASMSREEMSATVKGMFAAAQPTPPDDEQMVAWRWKWKEGALPESHPKNGWHLEMDRPYIHSSNENLIVVEEVRIVPVTSLRQSSALQEDEQERFEALVKEGKTPYGIGNDLCRHEDGYDNSFTDAAWWAWQARAALRQPGALPDGLIYAEASRRADPEAHAQADAEAARILRGALPDEAEDAPANTPPLLDVLRELTGLARATCSSGIIRTGENIYKHHGDAARFGDRWIVALAAKQAGKEA